MTKHTEVTSTTLVFEALVASEDFLNVRTLMVKTGRINNQVTAALSSLHKYKAVDFIHDASGTWWFATPDTDTRIYRVEERIPENKPRKKRQAKKNNQK